MYIPRGKKKFVWGSPTLKRSHPPKKTPQTMHQTLFFLLISKPKKKMPYHNFNCSRVTSGFVVKKLYRQFHAQHLLAILQQVMSTSGETQEQTKPYIKHVKKEES
uniref:Putative valosin n=1 Tax=Ixodes ricinus TaxID=34613 RepID=A0A0K8RJ80_IXORI